MVNGLLMIFGIIGMLFGTLAYFKNVGIHTLLSIIGLVIIIGGAILVKLSLRKKESNTDAIKTG